MGDPNRNILFAQFIKKRFPKARRVLCVADGKGGLARSLANKGFEVTVTENKPRFEGKKHNRITYKEGWFDRNTMVLEDIVVGMHPDEATAEIILAGEKSKKPWAVVPCCIKGDWTIIHGISGFLDWVRKLKTLCGYCSEYVLKMQGKNLVLYKR